MISFYVWLYVAVGFGYFLDGGLTLTKDVSDQFRVAMNGKEKFALGCKHLVLCVLFWPLTVLMKLKTDWWRDS